MIDSDYKGFGKVILHNPSENDHFIAAGDRVAQLLFFSKGVDPNIVKQRNELRLTERGKNRLDIAA